MRSAQARLEVPKLWRVGASSRRWSLGCLATVVLGQDNSPLVVLLVWQHGHFDQAP